MIEAHEKGWYDHDGGELLTYLWPYLRGIAFRGIDSELRYGIKDELDMLQEMAEKAHGRYGKDGYPGEGVHLDPPYESPIPGLKVARESSLSAAEQERAVKLMANLTDEDRKILEASYGRSIHQAAEFLQMPYSTYRDRLLAARERAAVLLKML